MAPFQNSYAHGYIDPEEYQNYPNIHEKVLMDNALEYLLNYCYEHATDSPNPIQDLLDKGLLDPSLLVHNCKEVKSTFDKVGAELTGMIKALNERIMQDKANDMARQYNCTKTAYWWCG